MVATAHSISREKIEEIAISVLEKHDLLGCAVNPVAVATAVGVEVFSVDLADDSVCGILRKENEQFRIYVNRDHHANRIRFTIAHELGHFFLHSELIDTFVDHEINLYRSKFGSNDSGDNPDAEMEVQANIFASALLMPRDVVRHHYQHTRDILTLAKRFGVSREAMGHRIANLGL